MLAISGAISIICSFERRDAAIVSGNNLNALTILPLRRGFRFLLFARDKASNISPASWVVNALVEATPISGPALVNKEKSDSLASELVGTLHIVKDDR